MLLGSHKEEFDRFYKACQEWEANSNWNWLQTIRSKGELSTLVRNLINVNNDATGQKSLKLSDDLIFRWINYASSNFTAFAKWIQDHTDEKIASNAEQQQNEVVNLYNINNNGITKSCNNTGNNSNLQQLSALYNITNNTNAANFNVGNVNISLTSQNQIQSNQFHHQEQKVLHQNTNDAIRSSKLWQTSSIIPNTGGKKSKGPAVAAEPGSNKNYRQQLHHCVIPLSSATTKQKKPSKKVQAALLAAQVSQAVLQASNNSSAVTLQSNSSQCQKNNSTPTNTPILQQTSNTLATPTVSSHTPSPLSNINVASHTNGNGFAPRFNLFQQQQLSNQQGTGVFCISSNNATLEPKNLLQQNNNSQLPSYLNQNQQHFSPNCNVGQLRVNQQFQQNSNSNKIQLSLLSQQQHIAVLQNSLNFCNQQQMMQQNIANVGRRLPQRHSANMVPQSLKQQLSNHSNILQTQLINLQANCSGSSLPQQKVHFPSTPHQILSQVPTNSFLQDYQGGTDQLLFNHQQNLFETQAQSSQLASNIDIENREVDCSSSASIVNTPTLNKANASTSKPQSNNDTKLSSSEDALDTITPTNLEKNTSQSKDSDVPCVSSFVNAPTFSSNKTIVSPTTNFFYSNAPIAENSVITNVTAFSDNGIQPSNVLVSHTNHISIPQQLMQQINSQEYLSQLPYSHPNISSDIPVTTMAGSNPFKATNGVCLATVQPPSQPFLGSNFVSNKVTTAFTTPLIQKTLPSNNYHLQEQFIPPQNQIKSMFLQQHQQKTQQVEFMKIHDHKIRMENDVYFNKMFKLVKSKDELFSRPFYANEGVIDNIVDEVVVGLNPFYDFLTRFEDNLL
ncbi:hypothetical protein HK099_004701 [Clydaea vesicula]|uniref:Uncharacterized protein n=1 Tax=Clydaea vesicula TaxID=447962 RepID=A0AAD5U6W7_9FUNG|nr:hypothetical protein HK099_004701 [Clydaea vesicula]